MRRPPITAACLALLLTLPARAAEAPKPADLPPAPRRALDYLLQQQHPTGRWGHKHLVERPSRRRGIVVPDGATSAPKDVFTPPTLVETSLVALAFLDAGCSPVDGTGAPALRRALDLIHTAVGDPTAAAAPNTAPLPAASTIVEKVFYTRGLDQALALEVLLRARDAAGADPAARRVAQGIQAALAAKQDADGKWHDHTTRRFDSQDHFLTAWATRALLVPLPPAP